jgi:hypothetical protein
MVEHFFGRKNSGGIMVCKLYVAKQIFGLPKKLGIIKRN